MSAKCPDCGGDMQNRGFGNWVCLDCADRDRDFEFDPRTGDMRMRVRDNQGRILCIITGPVPGSEDVEFLSEVVGSVAQAMTEVTTESEDCGN